MTKHLPVSLACGALEESTPAPSVKSSVATWKGFC